VCNKFVTICIYVMLPAAALAADYTWSTTNSSGSYTAATNWSPSSPAGGPGSGDKVIFGDTTNAGTLMLLDTNATVANWSSSTATNLYRVRVGAGASRSLAITGTLTKTGANVLDMVGNGSDLLSLTIGTLSLQAGTMTVGNSVLGRFSSFGVTTAVVTPKLEKRPSTLLPTVIVPACNDSVPMVSERRSEPLPTISNTLAPVLVSVPVIAKLREAPAPTLTR